MLASNASSDGAGDAVTPPCTRMADLNLHSRLGSTEPVAVFPRTKHREHESNILLSGRDQGHRLMAKKTGTTNESDTADSGGQRTDNLACTAPRDDHVPSKPTMHGLGPATGNQHRFHGETQQPDLVIQADATLVDGLRDLIVHHLKKSEGTGTVNFSDTQTELLEHHVVRLASYAQKIIHTLAFATRCFVKPQFDGDHGEFEGSQIEDTSVNACKEDVSGAAPRATPQKPPRGPRPTRKPLKLNDDEILNLYRNAQMEAAIEADWRGIQGPTPSRDLISDDGTNKSSASAIGLTASESVPDLKNADKEYVRIFSRALQQPGRSPRSFTAEIMDPSREAVCCQPRVGTVLNEVIGRTAILRHPAHIADTSNRYHA